MKRSRLSIGNIWRMALAVVVVVVQIVIRDRDIRTAVIAACLLAIASDWIVQAVRAQNGIYTALATYTAFAFIGFVLTSIDDPPRPWLYVIAGGTVTAAIAALLLAMLKGRSQKELDRLLFSEASSLAFFATMLAAITFGLLESWLAFELPSIWVFVLIGAASWVGATVWMRRRFA